MMAYLLLIDDDEDFATAAAKVLRKAGHEVAIQLDTVSAMASMERRRPDLAILDMMFPENASAGFELARAMRQHENLKDIPVLMLTAVDARPPLGLGSQDIDRNCLPVADFLEKPVDLDVLLNVVAGIVRGFGGDSGHRGGNERRILPDRHRGSVGPDRRASAATGQA